MLSGLPRNSQTAFHFALESVPPALLISLRSFQPIEAGEEPTFPSPRTAHVPLQGTVYALQGNTWWCGSLLKPLCLGEHFPGLWTSTVATAFTVTAKLNSIL